MNHDLYFIPILAGAVESASPKEALRNAFTQIAALGRQPEFQRGFEQFQLFMEAVRNAAAVKLEAVMEQAGEEIIAELLGDTFEGSDDDRAAALDLIQSNEKLRMLWNEFVDVAETESRTFAVTLLLLRDDETIGTIELSEPSGSGTFENVSPGSYVLQTDSGRVIWEGVLTGEDLIWSRAFPDTPFNLAADTAGVPVRATREEELLAGELKLRVVPGLEDGALHLSLERGGSADDA